MRCLAGWRSWSCGRSRRAKSTTDRSFVDAVFETVLPAVTVTRVPRDELFDRVLRGGFPESLQRPVDRRSDWFESYLTAVVEREVRDLSNVGSVAELTVMIRLIAARAGSLFNLADVARGAQLPHSTARNYLGLLRAVFLVVDVPAWTTSLTTRIVRAPKLFLIDSGLTAHLLGIGSERLRAEPHLAGGILEAFVAMELRKQISWSRIRPGLATSEQGAATSRACASSKRSLVTASGGASSCTPVPTSCRSGPS
jgi:predicted AAA+ superfamily ATPase